MNILKKIWDSRITIFIVIFTLYSIPFITSPLSGPGLFDFLWVDWGWNVGYYVIGEVILITVAVIIGLRGGYEFKEESDGDRT